MYAGDGSLAKIYDLNQQKTLPANLYLYDSALSPDNKFLAGVQGYNFNLLSIGNIATGYKEIINQGKDQEIKYNLPTWNPN